MKKDVWDIRVLQEVTLRVCFNDELTEEEAIDALIEDEYEDISDERDHIIRSIVGVE